MFGLYAYNGWTFTRIGRRSFNTLWGAKRRAARASRLLKCVVVVVNANDAAGWRFKQHTDSMVMS